MRLLPLILLAPLTTACLFLQTLAGVPTPDISTPVPGAVTFVATARPTGTDVPTLEPWPTPSPMRTDEPTPRPPPTRIPTFTPAPTATTAPIVLAGRGDDVVALKKADGVALLRITNSGAGYFSVWSYGAGGERLDLLVSTSGAYRGLILIDAVDNRPRTARLEVNSSGAWQIELLGLDRANRIAVPGGLEGKGDDVVLLSRGGTPDLAKISHSGSGYFSVWAYGGSRRNLLVSTSSAYNGTKALEGNTVMLEIHAGGAWNVSITTR